MIARATSIREGLEVFFAPKPDLIEVRILKTAKRTVSGYFNRLDLAVHAVETAELSSRTFWTSEREFSPFNSARPDH